MSTYSQQIANRARQKGEIVTNVIAGIIILIGVMGAIYTFSTIDKIKNKAVEMETAGGLAAQKLEALINSAWAAADLTAGDHSDPTAGSPLRWTVTDVTPRLKKIDVVAQHEQKTTKENLAQGVLVTGYRFNDF